MLKGTTKSGYKYSVDEDIFDDMVVLEILAECKGGDVTRLPELVLMVLGEEEKKKFYECLKNDKGRVPIQNAVEELFSMITDNAEGKNS